MKTTFKYAIPFVMFSVCLSQICSAAATPGGDEAAVAAEVKKMFKITSKATKLSSPAVEKVMEKGAAIYDTKVTITGPDGGSGIYNVKVIKKGSAITQFSSPSTTQKCPGLKQLIRKDFKLKTEQDTKTLEAALDVLYPISKAFGERDKKAKAIIRKGTTVTFIRGEFFKNLKGYIFTTDAGGAIVSVDYSLRIKR